MSLNSYEQSMFGQARLYACQLCPEATSCGARRVQLYLVPFFMLSLSRISPLGKPFPAPEQSFVISYISLKLVLANSCVALTNGLEIRPGVEIAPTLAMFAAIPLKHGNKQAVLV